MELGLEGRLAVVTGASAGIGAAVARSLAREKCQLILVARRLERLEEIAAEVRSIGGPAPTVVPGDVTDNALPAMVEDAVLRDGDGVLDILINCAGGSRALASIDAGDDQWAESFALNFDAARRLTHRLLNLIKASGRGRIISVTGSSEPKRMNAANAPKAALHVWSKALSREVAKDGVTVNCVAPGRIITEQILERVYPEAEERRRFAEREIPIGEFGEPDDVAEPIVFLASDRARYITGEIVHVDGGMKRFAH